MILFIIHAIIVGYLVFNNTPRFNLPTALKKLIPYNANDTVIGLMTLIAILIPFAGLAMVIATYYNNDDDETNSSADCG